ncbi:hypothetical protein [Acinetobacter sp. YH01026]|uniref:hypothetical protein n=1 Tax=Acinetobacter sp. YH01026 TaxID=2601039 RepID=UPI0015D458E5|nr:hypothetical protein [Acinetobacter sp. YH01026]
MKANEFFKKVGVVAVRSYLAVYADDLTNDLKRLVESHDLVESFGGVEMAKRYLDENLECGDSEVLRHAIADVESCK